MILSGDPKYTPKDAGFWHNTGHYFVPAEEPLMLLRGKDPVALEIIGFYIAMARDDAHRESAMERLRSFFEYQKKYPERTRVGCHNCGTEKEVIDRSAPSVDSPNQLPQDVCLSCRKFVHGRDKVSVMLSRDGNGYTYNMCAGCANWLAPV